MRSLIRLSIIISGSSGELNDKQSRQLVRVHANGLRLLSLLEDLLDLQKMERGNLEVFEEPFSPIDLADRLSARISNLIEHSGLRYQVIIDDRLPKLLIGDRLRIAQIVLHLLFNAFKFTKTGEVELTLKPLFSADRSFWTISVRDTGIGIPPAAQSLVFEIFRQADGSLQREFGGTGVGLAISRQLCHRMGGDITLLSEPGEGSTFTVILPMKVYKSGRQRQIVRKMERESYSSPGAEPRSQPLSIDTEKSQV